MNLTFAKVFAATVLSTVLGSTSSTYAQPTAVPNNFDSNSQLEISSKPEQLALNDNNSIIVAQARSMRGMASWYGPGFHGNTSASGEAMNQNAMTAAHRNLPFGTRVRVTNLNNNRSVVVRINDRGPFTGGRIIDVSRGAARSLGMLQNGVAPVRLEVLGR